MSSARTHVNQPRSRTPHRGCTLSWSATGAGPPVVLLHGMGIGADGWRPQVDALASRFNCLTMDNRGFGASHPKGEKVTVELMADDVLAVMDAQGWPSAHLVGHSLGGLVALYVAGMARQRVRSLALLCTFASGRTPTRLSWPILSIGIRSRIGPRRSRRAAFLELVMPRSVLRTADLAALAGELAVLFGHDLAEQPPIVMDQLRATKVASAEPFLTTLAGVPTLVVSAAEDVIAPPSAGRALAAGIQGARYVEIADAAHGVTIQKAAEVNALLLDHLDRAEQGAGAGTDRSAG
jgi:pimeloyl-ACP methyl ester carboxylesterase